MSRCTNATCQFCRRSLAMNPLSLEDARNVGEDERVRTSAAVFRRVHAGEIQEAFEDRAISFGPVF